MRRERGCLVCLMSPLVRFMAINIGSFLFARRTFSFLMIINIEIGIRRKILTMRIRILLAFTI